MEGAKNGRVPSRVYGYRKSTNNKYSLDIITNEAEIIKRVFHLYTEKQMSTYQIATLLNNEGVPTKRGGDYKWSQTVISGMLKNRLYIGHVCNGKSEVIDFISGDRKIYNESEWVIVERPEFRIVSDEIWHKANLIRSSRANSFHQFEEEGKVKRKRPSIKYPLSNLLVCANDNYSFRRRYRIYPSGYSYTYWTCSKRDLGAGSCDNKVKIDESQMHNAIAAFLKSLFENQENICKQFKIKVEKELNRKYSKEIDVKTLNEELHKISLDRDKLMELYIENEIDKVYLTKKIRPIEKRIDEINNVLLIFRNQAQITVDIEKCLSKMIDRINMHSNDWMDNAFLKSIFEKFIIYSDGRIEAIIKVDADSGSSLKIPFGEFVDEDKIPVPKYTNDIHGSFPDLLEDV